MFGRRELGRISFVVLLLALTSSLWGQELRGRLQGTATDESNAVIAGAKVTLHNDGTAVDVVRTSDASGHYLFDYVNPGDYTLTVEMAGFKTAVQKNITMQQRGDVTVDMKLAIGAVSETVTITESPVAVEFNTASRDLTLETKMVQDLPSTTRNPFQLAMLEPTVVNRGSLLEVQPYFNRTANEMDIGGGTKYRNDFLLDGTPLVAGNKLGYTPMMEAVTEYTIQQNSVDAEFGHTFGGVAVVSTKSGTNNYHGSGYFYTRNAGLNALTDRLLQKNADAYKYNNLGGTVGGPVIKKKLFFFGAYENMQITNPASGQYTLPTDLERTGDFSQSKNSNGTPRYIFDPNSFGTASNSRKQFVSGGCPTPNAAGGLTGATTACNVIPASKIDPLSAKILASLWKPNNPGDDPSGLNNYKYIEERQFHYYNYTARIDWEKSDKSKTFGRISRIHTMQDEPDYTNGQDPLKLRNAQGSWRNGWNVAADTVYVFNPTTTLDLRGAYYKVEDKRILESMGIGDYSSFWPGQQWWKDYAAGRPFVYAPSIVVDSTTVGQFGTPNFWFQEPEGYSAHGRLTKYAGSHALKTGLEIRWKRGQAARFRYGNFGFRSTETADKYSGATGSTGAPWASFLLGIMDASQSGGTATSAQYMPMQKANTEMYGWYIQDDWKVNRRLTLNLGLRYEYEGGWWDPDHKIQKALDLTQSIPGMVDFYNTTMQTARTALNGLSLAQVMQTSNGPIKSAQYVGAFQFTNADSKHGTVAYQFQFMPRVGVAYRLNDKTALRFGWARFYTPVSLIMPDRDASGEMPLGAFSPQNYLEAYSQGRPDPVSAPGVSFSNPFPKPVSPVSGKSLGRYTQLGDSIVWDQSYQRTPVSNRFNLSVQRELPYKFVLDVTGMVNYISHDQWSQPMNLIDPRIIFRYGSALTQSANNVNNPLNTWKAAGNPCPGVICGQQTVTLQSLLVPYPQYGTLTQTATDMRKTRYTFMEVRLQRPFTNGLSMLFTYGYARSKTQVFYDPQDQYDNRLTWMEGNYSAPGGTGTALTYTIDPRHNISLASTYALPLGRGKQFGANMNKVLDGAIGGWQLNGTWRYSSGQKLTFAQTTTTAAPTLFPTSAPVTLGFVTNGVLNSNGVTGTWFDITGFQNASGQYPTSTAVRPSNPWYYDGLYGPNFKNMDLSLSKQFTITERYKVQIRWEAYNALNQMNYATPNTTIGNSNFGKVLNQLTGYNGRMLQFGTRFLF